MKHVNFESNKTMVKTFNDVLQKLNRNTINSVENELETIRRKLSALLIHTDEKHPIECDIQIGESESMGLSTLLLPVVTAVFMQPDEGIIWFKIEGAHELMEFDDMSIDDLIHIYQELL